MQNGGLAGKYRSYVLEAHMEGNNLVWISSKYVNEHNDHFYEIL